MKSPRREPQDQSYMHKFRTEVGILIALDLHPRIAQYSLPFVVPLMCHCLPVDRYLGPLDPSEPFKDLLFTEAVNTDVQRYLHAKEEIIKLWL